MSEPTRPRSSRPRSTGRGPSRCSRPASAATASTQVIAPPAGTGQDLDKWWAEHVFPHTGDGHRCGASEHARHDARVVDAPDRPDLVGATTNWEG